MLNSDMFWGIYLYIRLIPPHPMCQLVLFWRYELIAASCFLSSLPDLGGQKTPSGGPLRGSDPKTCVSRNSSTPQSLPKGGEATAFNN